MDTVHGHFTAPGRQVAVYQTTYWSFRRQSVDWLGDLDSQSWLRPVQAGSTVDKPGTSPTTRPSPRSISTPPPLDPTVPSFHRVVHVIDRLLTEW